MTDDYQPEDDDMELKEEHEELYGLLLIANGQIDDVGSDSIWYIGLSCLGICVSIHMRWSSEYFGVPVDSLRSFGVYAVIFTVGFVIFSLYFQFREKGVYRQFKPQIMAYLEKYGLSIYSLVTSIADDPDLNEISEKLKLDKSFNSDQYSSK